MTLLQLFLFQNVVTLQPKAFKENRLNAVRKVMFHYIY